MGLSRKAKVADSIAQAIEGFIPCLQRKTILLKFFSFEPDSVALNNNLTTEAL